MKLRLAPLALVLVVLLSGCAAMLERSYVSSTAHVEYTPLNEDSSVLRAESYRGLVDDTAQGLAGGVDDIPFAVNLTGFRHCG